MVTTLSRFSNPDLCRIFNAITGQTVSRFTNLETGRQRIQKALAVTNTELADAVELAGLTMPGDAAPAVVENATETEAAVEPPAPVEATSEPEPVDLYRDPYGFVRRKRSKRSETSGRATTNGGADPKAPRAGGKLEQVLGLLRRDGGATVPEIMEATGWLPHTTRAYLSKGGAAGKAVTIMSEKAERDGKKTTVYSAR
jgi:hypothetical protein